MPNRPNPDKLLQRVQAEELREKRGSLKIYLGAAPGVGKTYEMLSDALQEREKGIDIVAGIIETHGRIEIENKMVGFEILPLQKVKYRGKNLMEFDLENAIKRQPGIILVDEMAHSNAPGLRHNKRWQDIKELLDRGIDVYTTLNVQHIESLNDDVAKIIGVKVKETVPDSMLEMANTIELIDLPPEALLKRLQEGKVYFPEQAALAQESFFKERNLNALRELALRVTAERVGAEVFLFRQDEGVQSIWPIVDKILVCVGPNPESLKLIRNAKRMANSLQAEWHAVYVDTPKLQQAEKMRRRALQNLHLAEQLGAQTRVLTGYDIVHEIIEYAHEQNITQIMIWTSVRSKWRLWFSRNLANQMVNKSRDIDILIMTGERTRIKSRKYQSTKKITPWQAYFFAFCMVTITTLVNFFLFSFSETSNFAMVYLLGTCIVALSGHIGPTIFSLILSLIAFDYFFIPPYGKFVVTDIRYAVTLLIMLIVTQFISYLTIIIRKNAESSRLVQRQTSSLFQLTRQLSNTRGIEKLVEIGVAYVSDNFNCTASILLPQKNQLKIVGKSTTPLEIKELSIAQWVYDLGQSAGFGTDTLSFSKALYVPLMGSSGTIGVLRIQPQTRTIFTPDQIRSLESSANQLALALEVDCLQEQARKDELTTTIIGVRGRLVEAVSHDLRTPVTTVMAAANNLINNTDLLDSKKIKKIGKQIFNETEQLNRLVNNLLKISYLETHKAKLNIQLTSIEECIKTTLKLFESKLKCRTYYVKIPKKLPLIPMDASLIQEVLFNLIDNAIKFTPLDGPIEIEVHLESLNIVVCVKDSGPGILTEEKNKLFEKFYRGRLVKSERGLGLGLAISQKIIEAHGGKIWITNRKEGGASFCFSLLINNE